MKTALSVIAVTAALALAPFVGGSFAVADDSAQRQQHDRFSPEDRAAFLDARIAALKAGLVLNAEQEKNWPRSNRRCGILPSKEPRASPLGESAARRATMEMPKSTRLIASPAHPNG